MKYLSLLIGLGVLFISLNCNNLSNNEVRNTDNTDSIEISNLLSEVYKWYSTNGSQIYFDVIVKDSFQVGLDTLKLKEAISKLKNSNYFSSEFIKNYEKIGLAVNNKLKNGKYYNEINFNFQDADIWTYSQDGDSDLWKKLKIKDLIIKDNLVSLKWYTDDYKDFGYMVKMKKENDRWRISYLEGLDYKKIIE